MEEKTLNDLKGQKVKISYQSMASEVSRDEGILNNITPTFITLELYNGTAKFISIDKIIRIEEML